MGLSPVLLAAVHAALRTLARQLAGDDGGDVDSLVDPIVFLALPTAIRTLRISRLTAELRKTHEREERCHPRVRSKGASWARSLPASARGRKRKRG